MNKEPLIFLKEQLQTNRVAKKTLPPLLILSKESHQIDLCTEILFSFFFPDESYKKLALSIFDGTNFSEEKFWDEWETQSLFLKKHFLWIQQIEKVSSEKLKNLLKLFQRENNLHHVLLTGSSLLKTTALYKEFQKKGLVIEFPELKLWEKEKKQVQEILDFFLKEGKRIGYPVAQQLAKRTAGDGIQLHQELEKILSYIGDKAEVTLQDFLIISSDDSQETVWQLGEAIYKFHSAEALRILRKLLRELDSPFSLLKMIRNQFQTELQIGLILERGGTSAEIAAQFPYFRGQILEQHLRWAHEYGINRCLDGMLAIDQVERELKSTQGDQSVLLDLLIIKLSSGDT